MREIISTVQYPVVGVNMEKCDELKHVTNFALKFQNVAISLLQFAFSLHTFWSYY